MSTVRTPAVAGTFYPADPAALRRQVDGFLAEARARASHADAHARPKMVVVPHAGYAYSGPIAASAYARLADALAHGPRVTRVVLLGPAHRSFVRGLAVPAVDAFDTPLGRVAIDRAGRLALAGLQQVGLDDEAHAMEHSLEVQLPFLQAVLGDDFTLLPLAVGDASVDEVAQVLERSWGGDETLVVISSDLSHYQPYDIARGIDRATAERIAARATDLVGTEACGAHALNGALAVATRRGLDVELLDLRNSGDTAGDKRRVVGYASFACTAGTRTAEDDDTLLGPALLVRARHAIASAFDDADLRDAPWHPALARDGATFVTLRDARGALRGCVGRLQAVDTLERDVRHNAQAAAFHDTRFAPVDAREWAEGGLRIEVSLLGPQEALPAARTREEALRLLHPHQDGIVLEWRGRRATFLPQVWSQLPRPEDFLEALVRKAGLPAGFWHEDVTLHRYDVRKFVEPGLVERDD